MQPATFLLFLAASGVQNSKAILAATSLSVKGDVIVCRVKSEESKLVRRMLFSLDFQT